MASCRAIASRFTAHRFRAALSSVQRVRLPKNGAIGTRALCTAHPSIERDACVRSAQPRLTQRKVAGLTALVVASLAVLPAGAGAQAPLLEFNLGIPTSDQINIYVAEDLGLFEKAGLRPHILKFQSGAPLLAGLKSESLDVVSTGLAIAFALGQNIPLKILFWTSDDSQGEGIATSPDGPVKSFADMGKARTIASASGTCTQVALYLIAQKIGVDFSKLNVVNIPAPLIRNALLSHSIDAGLAWPPYSVQLQAEGFPIADWDTAYTPPGGMCPRLTAVRPSFLSQHPDIGVKLVQVDAMASAAVASHPQVAIDALVSRLGLTPAVAKADIDRIYAHRPTYAQQLDPNSPYSLVSRTGGLVEKLSLATEILHKVGSIPAPVAQSVIQDAVDPAALLSFMQTQPPK